MPSPHFSVDLRTDTITRPSVAMRTAMAQAEVGDDAVDGDPTTKRLERTVAELLGKESALFFPSGTMANLAAILLLSKPGTEVLIDAESHIANWDLAGSAAFAGVGLRLVRPAGRVMIASDVRRAMRPDDAYGIHASLLCVENTHNGNGGLITTPTELRELQLLARDVGLPVHMDGARLWNASVATGTPLSEFCQYADTVMVAFSKGLGAPVGAALAGGAAHMRRADDIRKRLGGGMHQSGILAAAALYGVENNLYRLEEDHASARMFAEAVAGQGGVHVVPPETNIVMIDLPYPMANDIVREAANAGVHLSAWTPSRVRGVTHLDAPVHLTAEAGRRVASVLAQIFNSSLASTLRLEAGS
ncbi:MAG: aminotransferase class I/II-fold pyridoxal phosphate-dependent enzyme [Phycisphaerae bacterium]|nr:aminotransferase class I/II-fold pyridoxal phosphate-dependent enzyme [Gemmatimonadaceae bacterium]